MRFIAYGSARPSAGLGHVCSRLLRDAPNYKEVGQELKPCPGGTSCSMFAEYTSEYCCIVVFANHLKTVTILLKIHLELFVLHELCIKSLEK